MEQLKIQFLNGGLANQAFQYIFARYYALSHPGETMYLDDSYFALHTVHNGYELEKVFGIHAPMLSDCFDEEVWNFILSERAQGKSVPQILCENGIAMEMVSEVEDGYQTFNPFKGKVIQTPCNEYKPQILDRQERVYYHGYWVNKSWFARYEKEFLEEFRFPEITDDKNKTYLRDIQTPRSVSLHVRRGDYITVGWVYQLQEYRKLIDRFLENVGRNWDLFVFSDDLDWCRENKRELGLDSFRNVCYVEGNTKERSYIDMQLMSQCKAMILSNSAFCYLAALLNTGMSVAINPTEREV